MDEASSAITYTCPNCSAPVEIADSDTGWITCPACGEQFTAPQDPTVLDYRGDPSAPLAGVYPRSNEDELSALHIRNVTVARRAAIRSFSYMMVAIGACVVTAGRLVEMTCLHVWHHAPGVIRPIGYVLGAIAALIAIWPLWRRAAAFKEESHRSAIVEPSAPPDLSTLSDGSQQVRNLEEISE